MSFETAGGLPTQQPSRNSANSAATGSRVPLAWQAGEQGGRIAGGSGDLLGPFIFPAGQFWNSHVGGYEGSPPAELEKAKWSRLALKTKPCKPSTL